MARYVPAEVRHGQAPLSDEARQAIIEHRRTMNDVRQFVAANRHRFAEIWEDVPEPPRTIAGHMADMDPETRARLNAEWEASHG